MTTQPFSGIVITEREAKRGETCQSPPATPLITDPLHHDRNLGENSWPPFFTGRGKATGRGAPHLSLLSQAAAASASASSILPLRRRGYKIELAVKNVFPRVLENYNVCSINCKHATIEFLGSKNLYYDSFIKSIIAINYHSFPFIIYT